MSFYLGSFILQYWAVDDEFDQNHPVSDQKAEKRSFLRKETKRMVILMQMFFFVDTFNNQTA